MPSPRPVSPVRLPDPSPRPVFPAVDCRGSASCNVQHFRGGLACKAHRLCVSLNSRLESNKEEAEEDQPVGVGWNVLAGSALESGVGHAPLGSRGNTLECSNFRWARAFIIHTRPDEVLWGEPPRSRSRFESRSIAYPS